MTRRSLSNKTCAHCGTPFQPSHAVQRFCSHDCASKAQVRLIEKICLTCKKTFRPMDSRQRYCSHFCSGAPRRNGQRPFHSLVVHFFDESYDEIRQYAQTNNISIQEAIRRLCDFGLETELASLREANRAKAPTGRKPLSTQAKDLHNER